MLVARDANNIDMDLFRLISRVEQMRDAATPTDRKKWDMALDRLRCARPHIRQFMSESDRATT